MKEYIYSISESICYIGIFMSDKTAIQYNVKKTYNKGEKSVELAELMKRMPEQISSCNGVGDSYGI